MSLLADDEIFYTENLKDPTKKKNLLELINDFSKVGSYKVNTHKPAVFLYTNKLPEKIKKTIPFTRATKIKDLGTHNIKERRDLYTENQ